ncbi:MAG: hypothetical protein MUF51_10035, partial [Vicinamibacteria bacterium]|nr:hypothetical protein [Vicinamibacteria bacterium]
GFLPGAILLGAFQCTLYGSPLASGYGSIELMFRFKNATTNIARSTRWLMETGSPLIFLGFLAPIITNYRKWAAAVLLIIVAGIGPYIFYSVFDAWWYLRFYLPVIPLLLILSSALLTRVSTNLLSDLRVLPLAAACLLLCVTGMRKAEQEGSFDHRTSEQRFELVSLYAHRTLPENAAIICVHYSGSLRFYADRLTLRWDWIKEPRLDRWVAWLHKKGYPPYLIVEDWERTQFKARFSEYSALATLDWCHIAIQKRPPFVRIYDLHDRKPFVANEYEPIDTIP